MCGDSVSYHITPWGLCHNQEKRTISLFRSPSVHENARTGRDVPCQDQMSAFFRPPLVVWQWAAWNTVHRIVLNPLAGSSVSAVLISDVCFKYWEGEGVPQRVCFGSHLALWSLGSK